MSDELANLLERIVGYLGRYIVVGLPERRTIALWVVHTWAIGAFDVTPYLMLSSALMRSGKSTLLELIELLVANPRKTGACRNAKVPHYHPHDLRHRRITLWHQSGVPARELAVRAGHSKPSMSLDVYSHVMPAGEVPAERFEALLSGVERPPGVV